MNTDLGARLMELPSPTILVLGDLILDRYIWGHAERVSPEAPVLVLHADQEEVRLGGAASVANLLHTLQANVILAGVTGDDTSARVLRALLAEVKIEASVVLCEPGRVTTSKDRLIGRAANRHPNQILRVDREVRHSIHRDIEEKLFTAICTRLDEVQVVLVSDYAKGTCTPHLLQAIVAAASDRGIPVFVDPARITDYERYRGAAALIPNRAEVEMATGQSIVTPQDAAAAGNNLCERYGVPLTLVKLDQDGMVLACNSARRALTRQAAPGLRRDRRRRHGPCRNWPLPGMRYVLARYGPSCQYSRRPGGRTLRRRTSESRLTFVMKCGESIIRWPRLSRSPNCLRLPPGFAAPPRKSSLPTAALICCMPVMLPICRKPHNSATCWWWPSIPTPVCVGSKGRARPVIGEANRAQMLAALGCVTYVIIFEEDTPHSILRALRPEFLVKGGTYSPLEVVGRDIVEEYGGHVGILGMVDGISTSKIINGSCSWSYYVGCACRVNL